MKKMFGQSILANEAQDAPSNMNQI